MEDKVTTKTKTKTKTKATNGIPQVQWLRDGVTDKHLQPFERAFFSIVNPAIQHIGGRLSVRNGEGMKAGDPQALNVSLVGAGNHKAFLHVANNTEHKRLYGMADMRINPKAVEYNTAATALSNGDSMPLLLLVITSGLEVFRATNGLTSRVKNGSRSSDFNNDLERLDISARSGKPPTADNASPHLTQLAKTHKADLDAIVKAIPPVLRIESDDKPEMELSATDAGAGGGGRARLKLQCDIDCPASTLDVSIKLTEQHNLEMVNGIIRIGCLDHQDAKPLTIVSE
jgi:hypothetical protein